MSRNAASLWKFSVRPGIQQLKDLLSSGARKRGRHVSDRKRSELFLEILESRVVLTGKVGTDLLLSASANPAVFGQSVTLAAVVTPKSGSGVPTGTVSFTDNDGANLGAATLQVVGGIDTATLTVSNWTIGKHHVRADYGGDAQDKLSSDKLHLDLKQANPVSFLWRPGSVFVGRGASVQLADRAVVCLPTLSL